MDKLIAVGNTYEYKEYLKEQGFQWDPREKVWWVEVEDDAIDSMFWKVREDTGSEVGLKIDQ